MEIIKECFICFLEKKDIATLPCNHEMCELCLLSWEKFECPFCREQFSSYKNEGDTIHIEFQHQQLVLQKKNEFYWLVFLLFLPIPIVDAFIPFCFKCLLFLAMVVFLFSSFYFLCVQGVLQGV